MSDPGRKKKKKGESHGEEQAGSQITIPHQMQNLLLNLPSPPALKCTHLK